MKENCASPKDMHYVSGSAAAFRAAQIDLRVREDLHYISGSAAVALLRPLVEIRRRAASAGHVRIRVDELVGRQLVDRARLRLALNNLRVLLRRPPQVVIRRDLRHIARHVNLHEVPVGRETSIPFSDSPNGKEIFPSGALICATTKSQAPMSWFWSFRAVAVVATTSETAANVIPMNLMMLSY